MIYKSTSIKEVIGRVIRGTRVQDSSFINDMGEWIPEAMGYMRTRFTLSPMWKDVEIEYHKGKLPCGLRTLTAVSYGGQRLRYNAGVQPYDDKTYASADTVFRSTPTVELVPESVGVKIFTAPTPSSIYALDYVTLADGSTINVTSVVHKSSSAVELSMMQQDLNGLGIGTFIATWENNKTVLTISANDTTVVGIAYHEVTLDSEVEFMTVVDNSYASARQKVSADTIEAVNCQPYGSYTYYTELDYINTSLCDGCVRLFYKAIPTDEDGFPLIPDNEDYKEALYWYVRSKMIGAGYKDTVVSMWDCMTLYDKHAVRAIGQIRYPSVDQMETKLEISTRLILPENYFETFFANPGKEGTIDI